MTELPKKSWLMLGCDLTGPFPTDEYLLVCVDYFLRYPEFEILTYISSDAIIRKLRQIFCRFGCPELLVIDSGSQFVSTEFELFLKEYGVKHRRVTPYLPQANGETERFNRDLKKTVQTAITEGRAWRKVLCDSLLSYRNAPHSTTGVSPSQLLFSRNLRDKLPISSCASDSKVSRKAVKERDQSNKAKMKFYEDKRRKSQTNNQNYKRGDLVSVINCKRNKFTGKWNKQPFTVIQEKGASVLFESASERKCLFHKPHFF